MLTGPSAKFAGGDGAFLLLSRRDRVGQPCGPHQPASLVNQAARCARRVTSALSLKRINFPPAFLRKETAPRQDVRKDVKNRLRR